MKIFTNENNLLYSSYGTLCRYTVVMVYYATLHRDHFSKRCIFIYVNKMSPYSNSIYLSSTVSIV